jgi:hypothetical protein
MVMVFDVGRSCRTTDELGTRRVEEFRYKGSTLQEEKEVFSRGLGSREKMEGIMIMVTWTSCVRFIDD